jgi:hypothetical protein
VKWNREPEPGANFEDYPLCEEQHMFSAVAAFGSLQGVE